jgi:lipooligosaccharide transport system permease protein
MGTPALLRVVEREVHIFRRLWRGTVFSSLVNPLMFLVAMGIGLGDLVDERSGTVEGLAYLEFVTPGLLAAAAMQAGAGQALWPVMAGMKWLRTYHGMAASPLSPLDVFGGFVVWNSLRAGIYAVAFLVVAALLGGVPSGWGVLAVPAAILTAAAFIAPIAAFAAARQTDQSFPLIMRLGVLPLFLFSGTFFPVDRLPAALEGLARVSPLWHGVQLCRGATTGSIDPIAALGHAGVLAALVAVGVVAGRRTFTRGITP